jgi:hypothetical protein
LAFAGKTNKIPREKKMCNILYMLLRDLSVDYIIMCYN